MKTKLHVQPLRPPIIHGDTCNFISKFVDLVIHLRQMESNFNEATMMLPDYRTGASHILKHIAIINLRMHWKTHIQHNEGRRSNRVNTFLCGHKFQHCQMRIDLFNLLLLC